MADYQLKVSIRNGRILEAIKAAGCRSVRQFAMQNGLNTNVLLKLIGFRHTVVGQDGRLTRHAQALCDALCALPEDLWTDEQLWANLPHSSWTFDLSRDQAQALSEGRPMEEWLDLERVPKMLERLSDRERAVVEKVVMQEKYLHEAGADMGVTRERIRQIEGRALRKMRAPVRDAEGRIVRYAVDPRDP